MFLAFKEMRRSAVRFGLLALAIGLLAFLILFQQALQDGLITSFVGALRNQSAPVLVYSVDAQRTLQGSFISPPLETAVRNVDGVSAAARLGQTNFTVSVDGAEPTDAAVIATDDPALGLPSLLTAGRQPQTAGEAVADEADFELGDEIRVLAAPGGEDVVMTVVGLASAVQLSVTPTVFTDFATFESAVRAVNPDATTVAPNALALAPVDGVSAESLAERVNAAEPDAEALTRDQAADRTPGVDQVRQSFQLIFLLYGLVVPLVTGLFFLIITVQKTRSLTLLRAAGARTGTLGRALVVQVITIMGVGLAVGIALFAPLSQARVGGLTLRFDLSTVVTWSALFVLFAFLSAGVSLRRVLAIDPFEATTGGGLH